MPEMYPRKSHSLEGSGIPNMSHHVGVQALMTESQECVTGGRKG